MASKSTHPLKDNICARMERQKVDELEWMGREVHMETVAVI